MVHLEIISYDIFQLYKILSGYKEHFISAVTSEQWHKATKI